ncbi:MAG: 50S ribosomal protein L23 [Mycobacteriales bacterium]
MATYDRYNAARDLLIRPVVSEKSYALLDENKYTFIVHQDANKTQIRQAVELLFDVEVTGVNTINRKGKRKRTRAGFGKRPDTRRAIVSVDPNPKDASKKSRIDIFGGPVS